MSALATKDLSIFPIWKTVTLGLLGSVDAYRAALQLMEYQVTPEADHALEHLDIVLEETPLDLALVSVSDLGSRSSFYGDLCRKAQEVGLELCPAEVGPALRLQYPDQSPDEWTMIAMKAIDLRGIHRIFDISHGKALRTAYSPPDMLWMKQRQFVFVRPRPAA